jgi:SAM-dependent methyltransferase
MGNPSIHRDPTGIGFTFKPIQCPTCGIDDAELLGLRGGRYHRHGLGVPSRIVQCRRCSLVYPNPFPVPLDSHELYGDPEKYFAHQASDDKLEYFRNIVAEMQEKLGRPVRSVLDVGSGRGEFLHVARQTGIEVTVGLELSASMSEHARTHYDVDVMTQTVEEYAKTAARRFDVVVLSAVLEHVHDPDSMIAATRSLTEPGSLLYLDLPNEPHLLSIVGNAINRVAGRDDVLNLSPTFPPYHVFGFNPRALSALLAKYDFAVDTLRIHAAPRIPARGGLDSAKAFVGRQIMRLANLTGTASNMFVWARRVSAAEKDSVSRG